MSETSAIIFSSPEFTISQVTYESEYLMANGLHDIKSWYSADIKAPIDDPNPWGIQAFIGEADGFLYAVIGGTVRPEDRIPDSEQPTPTDRAIEVRKGALSDSPPTGACRRLPPPPADPFMASTIWSSNPRGYLFEREMEANVAALANCIKAPGVRSEYVISALRAAWRRKYGKAAGL